jgi:hypothetical protein
LTTLPSGQPTFALSTGLFPEPDHQQGSRAPSFLRARGAALFFLDSASATNPGCVKPMRRKRIGLTIPLAGHYSA